MPDRVNCERLLMRRNCAFFTQLLGLSGWNVYYYFSGNGLNWLWHKTLTNPIHGNSSRKLLKVINCGL